MLRDCGRGNGQNGLERVTRAPACKRRRAGPFPPGAARRRTPILLPSRLPDDRPEGHSLLAVRLPEARVKIAPSLLRRIGAATGAVDAGGREAPRTGPPGRGAFRVPPLCPAPLAEQVKASRTSARRAQASLAGTARRRSHRNAPPRGDEGALQPPWRRIVTHRECAALRRPTSVPLHNLCAVRGTGRPGALLTRTDDRSVRRGPGRVSSEARQYHGVKAFAHGERAVFGRADQGPNSTRMAPLSGRTTSRPWFSFQPSVSRKYLSPDRCSR